MEPISSRNRGLTGVMSVLLLALIFFMPASTFLMQLLRHAFYVLGHPLSARLVQITVGWKEIILVLLFLLFIWVWWRRRQFPFQISRFDLYALFFILIGTVWGGLISHRGSLLIFGFRYDFSPLLYYFAARAVWQDRKQILSILRWLVYAAIPVFLFAALQTFVLPLHFMERFGYSWGNSVTGNPLPPYHLIGNSLIRAMATFPGPNSLAMYAVTIFLALFFLGRFWFARWLWVGLAAFSFLVLIITFSRGHLISLMLSGLVFLVYVWLRRKPGSLRMKSLILSGSILALLLVSFFGTIYLGTINLSGSGQTRWYDLLLHEESSAIHREVRIEAWQSIKRHPLGTGIGTSGLATTNTGGTVFNPESWYIQILQEFGWIALLGIVLFFYKICELFWVMDGDLFDPSDRGLLAFLLTAFLATVFSANFLPSWFEVGSLTFWVLFGFFVTDYFRTFPRSEAVISQEKA